MSSVFFNMLLRIPSLVFFYGSFFLDVHLEQNPAFWESHFDSPPPLSLSPYANVGDVECAMCSSVAVLAGECALVAG